MMIKIGRYLVSAPQGPGATRRYEQHHLPGVQAIQIDPNQSNISMEIHEAPRSTCAIWSSNSDASLLCMRIQQYTVIICVSWESWHFVSLFFVAVIRVMVASDRACSGMPKTLCFLDCQVHSRSMLCQLVVSTYLRISDQVENCPRKGQESKNCYEYSI